DDATIYKTMQFAEKTGTLVCMHAENGGVIDSIVSKAIQDGKTAPRYHALTRPVAAEAEATERTIALAAMAHVPVYIVHLSCDAALRKVIDARADGQAVFSETCPQYLFLSLEDMGKPGFEDAKLVFTPPVREKWNQEKLWSGLIREHIQVVATDHCPFNYIGQKDFGKDLFTKIPNGGAGIEHRMQLLYQGGVIEKRFSLNRWVELTSTAPSKIFGLYPRKGTIAVGSDADIVIWDPKIEHEISVRNHHMRVDYSMFEGLKVCGNAETVISRGKVLIDNYSYRGEKGMGNYIKRNCYTEVWK
ncbi:MAG: amidohydrolase family protein, partial [Ignavibacteria bacterium]|nr:amidohydrolase family protein [Ignavibacteria bacterium]